MTDNPFSREKEGSSVPKDLIHEALEHFKRAADKIELSPDRLKEQEQRAEDALRHQRTPSLPNLKPVTQT